MIDISGLDERAIADKGEWIDLKHPETGEPITGTDKNGEPITAQVLVFGRASHDVQDQLHEMQKERAAKTDDEPPSIKRSHEDFVRQAVIYIGGFRNLESDGEDLSDKTHAARVMDMTFPRMKIVDGSAATPGGIRFELANKPWAIQVIDAAGKQRELVGNV